MKMRYMVILALIGGSLFAGNSFLQDDNSAVKMELETEQGVIAVLKHTYQSGTDGTVFDYRTMGGQEILFPFARYNAALTLLDRHRIQYLYQPLRIETQSVFKEDVTIDGTVFDAGSNMNIGYGFPFWRLTYNYDLIADPDRVLAIGASLQLRNASLQFGTVDGTSLTVSQNLGPVPALNLYSRWKLDNGLVLTAEATGSWASSAFFNGASFEFEGSLLDAALRMGYQLDNGIELFGNARFLGGHAEGTSEYPDLYWTKATEDFAANYLSTISITLGAVLK